MKILWVKAGKLLPVDTGGKIRSYNILRRLARDHEVHLLSYYGGQRDVEYEAEITRQWPGAEVIYTAAPDAGFLEQSLDYLRHLPSSAPYAVSKFTHPKVRRAISGWFSQGHCEVAVCDFLSASANFPPTLPVPTVLFQHNVETSLWRRLSEREMNPARKVACAIEAAKMARYERRALGWFHHVIAVSRGDRGQMLSMYQGCQISVVPTGVDMSQYRAGPSTSAEPPIVVFTGSMDWEPNIDAMEYFCWDIWPAVLAAYPRARFQIVGRHPHHKVRRLASSSVEVTGTVSSVSDHLRNATLVVVPLRIGGGTRLKIYEAMAMGKAVVSTSIGAEGLDVQDGRDLVLADEPGSFSESIIQLLRDAGLRHKYERAGAELVAGYDWSVIARQFATVLSGVVADFATDRPSSAPSPVAP